MILYNITQDTGLVEEIFTFSRFYNAHLAMYLGLFRVQQRLLNSEVEFSSIIGRPLNADYKISADVPPAT